MSIISRITTWADGQTLFSADLNGEFNNIINLFNNLDSASSTWSNVKISSTALVPLAVASSATKCEISTDCSGSNGTPIHTFRRGSGPLFSFGVDPTNSNAFTFGTTALTTNIAFEIPSTGAQVQFPAGAVGTPGISFIGDTTSGFYTGLSGNAAYSAAGTKTVEIGSQGVGIPNGTVSAPGLYLFNSQTSGISRGGSNILTLNTNGSSGAFIQLEANGDIITSQLAPVATNATAGFFFLPTVAGTPTGTPSSYTGNAACLIDTSALKLWVHFGAGWKSVALT